ncbi:hypothetical protein PVK06_008199 [Gossypium arboreum]|uniref:Uncharacterized protein n=1 Tax=Gossypium arboreum TaxID=29729 RepID=A0ABR0QJK3_GOSAR|nr:hypothetical protein PVK06_008199 [Gossypium arboreum]
MARTRGLTKKANKSTKEHASFATAIRESESLMPVQKKELGRRINVNAILYRETAECASRQTDILVFPSLVMSLCQQKGIVAWGDEEIMDNKESSDIEECLRKIDSLFEDGIFAAQEDTIVDKEAATAKEEIVAEEEKEREEKDSDVNIVTAPESVGANIENLELDGVRQAEVAKVTSEEQDNSLAIVVYTRPHQVAYPIQEATNDTRAKLKLEQQSENSAKPRENKRKCSKDKKDEKEETSCNRNDGCRKLS